MNNNENLDTATNINSINDSNNTYNDDLSNLSGMSNSFNFNGNYGSTTVLDNRINELKKQYDALKKWDNNDWYYNELKRLQRQALNSIDSKWKWAGASGPLGMLAYGIKAADVATKTHQQHKSRYDNAKKLQETLFKQIQDAESQKVSYMANIESQQNKYQNEFKALQKVGINNPYMLLKSGPLGNSGSIGLSNMGSPNMGSFSKPGELDKDMLLKLLIALIGSGSKIGAAFA